MTTFEANGTLPSLGDLQDEKSLMWQERSFRAYDTMCFIKAPVETRIMDGAVALCRHYEQLFSHTLPESDIGRINAARGRRTHVDSETATLVRAALGYCKISDGLYDITMAPLSDLWNYHRASVPKTSDIEEAKKHVHWECVDVSGNTVVVADPEAQITLGGIAKGYIADKVRDFLAENGEHDAFISLGGNVVVAGRAPHGGPWRIGVRSPEFHHERARRHTRSLAIARSPHGIDKRALADVDRRYAEKPAFTLSASDLSIVTSGIYERCFRDAETGREYHHIIDPRTGFPCESNLASATVLSRRSLDGDGLSTSLLIMGMEPAARFIESLPGTAALFITRDGAMRVAGDDEILHETGADALVHT